MNGVFIHNGILGSNILLPLQMRKRSFELMQNEAEYRALLVSKSLPIKKRIFAKYSISAIKTIRNVFLRERSLSCS